MPLFSFEGLAPTVHPDAFIAPTATLVGDVRVEAGASIRYGAVLRADMGAIIVCAGANVQDGCIVHGGDGSTVQDGARTGARCLGGPAPRSRRRPWCPTGSWCSVASPGRRGR